MINFSLPPVQTLKKLSQKRRHDLVAFLASYTVHLFHPETVDLDVTLKNIRAQAKKNGLTRQKMKEIIRGE